MASNDRLLLRNLGIASAVVVGVLILISLSGYTDEKSVEQTVQDPAPTYSGKVGELPHCNKSDLNCWINSVIDD